MFRPIRGRMNELEAEKVVKLEQLRQLRQKHPQVDPSVIDLLDALPLAHRGLTLCRRALLRALFEAFRLEVHYDQSARWPDCQVTIDGDAVEQLTTESGAVLQASTAKDLDVVKRSLLVRAPNPTSRTPIGSRGCPNCTN
jgi:hypothetical protein